MKYTVKGNKSKGFTLADEKDATLGHVAYNNLFSRKATVSLYNNEHYDIIPSGFWQVSFDIAKAEYKIGNITLNWKGTVVITIGETAYLCKKSGFWGRSYELRTADELLATVRQGYEWAKMGYSYEIDVTGSHPHSDLPLLFLLMAYCTSQQYAGAGAV